MKKIKFLVLLIMLTLLVGCNSNNSKEAIKTCKLDKSMSDYRIISEYNIYGQNGVANKVVTIERIVSSDEDTLDFFETYMKNIYEDINNQYGGYIINIEKKDDEVVSKITIDYNEMDLEKYTKDNNAQELVNSNNQMLISSLVSMYEASGAVCE